MGIPKEIPPGFEFALAGLIVALRETEKAAVTTQDFGRNNYDPDADVGARVLNRDWLTVKLDDLGIAIARVRHRIDDDA